MTDVDNKAFIRSLRPILPWALAGNVAIFGILISVNFAFQGSLVAWAVMAACLLVFFVVGGRLAWWLIGLAQQRLRWWKEFDESGKLRISLRESLPGRFATDGGTATVAAFLWSCFKLSLKWSALLVAMFALRAWANSELNVFQQHVLIYAAVGGVFGLLAGVLVQIVGRRLKIVEGSHVSMNALGDSGKVWQLSQLADAEITDGPSGYSSIRLRFGGEGTRPTELRVVTQVQAEVADDLRRLFGEGMPATSA